MSTSGIASKNLFPSLVAAGVCLYYVLQYVPAYTRWVTLVLVLPSIFFVVRKESKLDLRKVGFMAVSSMGAALLWDNVAMRLDAAMS